MSKLNRPPYQVAIAENLKFYFSGKPCKNSNIAMRRTSDRACVCAVCAAQCSAKKLSAHHAKRLEREAAQNLENAQGAK